MGNFSINTEGNRTSLVYALSEDQSIDSFSLGMLTGNRIAGIAETTFTQMDANKYVVYNITAKVPAAELFYATMARRKFLEVFSGITNALLSADEYMISADSIVLDLNMIYCDVVTNETVLICLPVNGLPAQVNPCTFLKDVLMNTKFDQSEDCDYVTTMLNYLNTHPVLPLLEFRKLLMDLNQHSTTQAEAYSAPVPHVQSQSAPFSVQQPPQQPMQGDWSQPDFQPQHHQQLQQPPQQIPQQAPPPMPPQQPSVFHIPGQTLGQTPGQFAVPQPNRQEKPQQPVKPDGDEKPMSLFYLLQHYNKENKAIYDAQKQQKATIKGSGPKLDKKTNKKKKKGKTPDVAIPGMFERQEYRPGQPGQAQQSYSSQPEQQAGYPPQPSNLQDSQQLPGYPPRQPIAQQYPPQPHVVQPQPVLAPQQPAHSLQVQPKGAAADFGDTDYFTDGGSPDTLMMGADIPGMQRGPYLLRIKNNERIPISKNVFRMGRDSQNGPDNQPKNDYVVTGNGYVGNSHAIILMRSGEYYLVDSNSQNGTFLNGKSIPTGTEAKLSHGSRFALANEEFEFKLF